jgi:hypothetical protein
VERGSLSMFASSGALETRSGVLALSVVPPGPKLGFSNFLHYVILMVSLSGVSLEVECRTYYRDGTVVAGYLQLRRAGVAASTTTWFVVFCACLAHQRLHLRHLGDILSCSCKRSRCHH